ncbi:pantetheine-phosphate adenylyltransferase [Candidatus Oleimmundimicrobium sp.]|uniref:pantetheine-phosphate adenylyltransferase n=1 Tax=Candidatus Oleimmundimicrobium sp. TaxID=3060597 RepID=UPI0027269391|nr:pantetheine-phosphate adenylyltransferase [Candidatus Oleimmundimicrobium sp.]MDO8885344.1 pantetheine-phosphate adenylyltransferase [Candidatus Oleimmundimicrobium sp.]
MKVAVCPGSFDPITSGHLDVIERGAYLFEKVVVGVFEKTEKNPLFSLDERIGFIESAIKENSKLSNVEVESFNSLLIDFAHRHKACAIIKGLRAVSDFEHEFQMAQFNRKLDKSIETIFVMASPKYAYLSSSAVKEIAKFGGCIEGLVTKEVEKGFRKVFKL